MLVLISDLHLTDGSSGETINCGAFEKFTLCLEGMAEKAQANNVEVVFLGDILDLIRSDYWLKSKIRPWSREEERDNEGKTLKEYTLEIVKRIRENGTNLKSINYLKDFKGRMKEKGIAVRFTYLIGNHDWLINRYDEVRVGVTRFLDLGEYNENVPFRTSAFWEGYQVFARHGDIFDPFNFDGQRDDSSLGDAIVIDLVNKFSKSVEDEIGCYQDPDLIYNLKEIDNVRPLIDIPLWIQGVCQRAKSKEIAEKVKEVWNNLVDDFLKIDFVQRHDRSWQIDIVDGLQLGLKISKYLSFKNIRNLPLRKLVKEEDDYKDKALNEEYLQKNKAKFVVYGHTHNYTMVPLDLVLREEEVFQKIYFNTGTWRKVQVRTFKKDQKFLSWSVMTFIAFYLEGERKDKQFEIWNGALG
ncbi:MAG: metallophosphoesterase [bacterium]